MVPSTPHEAVELSHIRRFVVTFHMPDRSFIDEPIIVAHTRAEAIALFNALYLGWPEVPSLDGGDAARLPSDLALALKMELFEPDGGEPLASYDLA